MKDAAGFVMKQRKRGGQIKVHVEAVHWMLLLQHKNIG